VRDPENRRPKNPEPGAIMSRLTFAFTKDGPSIPQIRCAFDDAYPSPWPCC
jgi:hypothetical protein